MAQASFIQDGLDRVETAVKSFEKDFRRLQRRADKRRRELERQAERQVRRIRTELRKNAVVKRAKSLQGRVETLRGDAVKALEEQIDSLLGTLRIASQGEVERLERKVGQLNRKVRALEKSQEETIAA